MMSFEQLAAIGLSIVKSTREMVIIKREACKKS
jgi:hypothetical protein